ncbi:YbfB/YjiJ family MFS transporter [Marinobacter sp. SS21]|uniref:YbfB/YjiJ family MFS transporter n=1 Tax=Marinobacter sp. SS21 TaxID=2979460 RepID=UPI00232E506C|nr:YbfB/YjiJ family MFS transporter [Marinobacter sp. SS21]MDC0662360.1 YbfB/YjiJ family MFS transporter [Marinobacter sp. SS21]
MIATGFNRAALAGVTAGMAATFLGVGLARFAYTAILPELIQQEWFSEAEAAYLGAANLIGYAAGALLAVPVARRLGTVAIVLACGFLVVLSFIACAWPIAFSPYLIARAISGLCGAALMVLVPSAALTALQPGQRAKGASLVFTGVGLGILISATMVPLLAHDNLSHAWLALTATGALALWLLTRTFAAAIEAPGGPAPARLQTPPTTVPVSPWLIASVALAYAMDAIGFVPHTLFWVDYLQRELGLSVGASALHWGLFGVGAMCGPFVIARLGRQFGWHTLLVGALAVKGGAVLLPLVNANVVSLALSSVLVGALVPGLVAIVSGRMSELATATGHARLWGLATATFACAQGLAAALFAWFYDNVDNGANLIFAIGGGALLAGALIAESFHRRHAVRAVEFPDGVPARRNASSTCVTTYRNRGQQ